MTPDVVIEHCRLRLVRSTAWPWGPERESIVQDAVRALPQLIAEELSRLIGGVPDGTLDAPLRVELSIQPEELRFVEHGLPPGAGAGPLARRVFDAVRIAAASHDLARLARSGTEQDAPPPAPDTEPAVGAHAASMPLDGSSMQQALTAWHASVVRALLRHRELGGLPSMLAQAPAALLESWQVALSRWHGAPPVPAAAAPGNDVVAEAAQRTLAAFDALPLASPLARRVHTLLEVAAQGHAPARWLEHPALRCAGQSDSPPAAEPPAPRREPPPDPEIAGTSPPGQPSSPPAMFSRAAPLPVTPARPNLLRSVQTGSARSLPRATRASTRNVDVQIESALPFLALVPLLRMGFVDALHAAVIAAGADLHAVAAAFAYKLLEAPQRGWRRNPGAQRAAAAFAASFPLDAHPDSEALGESARLLEGLLGPSDDFLAGVIAEGHNRGAPLLLTAAPSQGQLLVDCEGLFPIAWSPELDCLPSAARALIARELVLVPEAGADAAVLAALDGWGARFVTDAPPTASEPWRRIGSPRRALWTNDPSSTPAALVSPARPLARASELVEQLFRTLDQRPALPRAVCALERTLSVAAAVGLGSIAWSLWREQEPVDPLLSLERLASLEARVTFERDAVRVRVPMGARHRDLYRHGFTGSFTGVPWLDGRELVIGGG